eukprot:TRINITY_DN2474_c0_g2_i1.p2 TRINITY_DN2474_c0_g2~~TRINITY_DN2474_c0_g2_i1.p2  ORF type:complete len:243 (-),score=57.90 TRINITY_DN2474_c0_g2_i1:85-813(-)
MEGSDQEFRNVSSGPTEDNLSVIGIRDTINQSVRVDESDPRFLCCIRVPRLATYFCCESVPLRKGLFILGVINLVVGIYALIVVLTEIQSQAFFSADLAHYGVQAFGIVNCSLLAFAAEKFISCFAKISYYWQIIETSILNYLTIMAALNNNMSFTLSFNTISLIVIVLARSAYTLYVAYILYSFILLIERKANMNLVAYGPDLVKLMENIKKQAAAMDIRNVSLTEIDVTANDSVRKDEPT